MFNSILKIATNFISRFVTFLLKFRNYWADSSLFSHFWGQKAFIAESIYCSNFKNQKKIFNTSVEIIITFEKLERNFILEKSVI